LLGDEKIKSSLRTLENLGVTISHKLAKNQSWENFEIVGLFKWQQAIQKCNKMMFFLILHQKGFSKWCAQQNGQVASSGISVLCTFLVFKNCTILALHGCAGLVVYSGHPPHISTHHIHEYQVDI
jgi:hypothetical protein